MTYLFGRDDRVVVVVGGGGCAAAAAADDDDAIHNDLDIVTTFTVIIFGNYQNVCIYTSTILYFLLVQCG